MKKNKIKTNEQKLIDNHIFIEKGKFFAGLIIIFILIIVMILSILLNWQLPSNLYLGFIAGAYITSSSRIKSLKDILNLK